MDNQSEHELASEMRRLTQEVGELNGQFKIFGPMLQQQVTGMTDLTNRQTKAEGRLDALEKARDEDRERARFNVGQIIAGSAAVAAIVAVIISMVPHK